ncbi:MAG: hypothetical protein U0W40_17675 [Acidimicrobiia bacterium]
MIGPRFAEVLEGACAGDEPSFATIWRDLNPALVRYLRVVAPHDADDLASETWATVTTCSTGSPRRRPSARGCRRRPPALRRPLPP